MFEELFVQGEAYETTAHEKIFVAANASSLLVMDLSEQLDALEDAVRRNDARAIIRTLHMIVPEYHRVDELPTETVTGISDRLTSAAKSEYTTSVNTY